MLNIVSLWQLGKPVFHDSREIRRRRSLSATTGFLLEKSWMELTMNAEELWYYQLRYSLPEPLHPLRVFSWCSWPARIQSRQLVVWSSCLFSGLSVISRIFVSTLVEKMAGTTFLSSSAVENWFTRVNGYLASSRTCVQLIKRSIAKPEVEHSSIQNCWVCKVFQLCVTYQGTLTSPTSEMSGQTLGFGEIWLPKPEVDCIRSATLRHFY